MNGRYVQLIFIILIAASIGIYHAWSEKKGMFSPDQPDLQLQIAQSVFAVHRDLMNNTKWPVLAEGFRKSESAQVDLWPGKKITSVKFPYQGQPASFELRGEFMIHGRVYGADTYHRSLEDLSPVDIAFGFGVASDDRIASQVNIKFGNRSALPKGLPRNAFSYFSNMHLIPASPAIKVALLDAKKDDYFVLRGYVTTFRQEGYRPWVSDTSYNNHQCEIILVTEFLLVSPDGSILRHVNLLNENRGDLHPQG